MTEKKVWYAIEIKAAPEAAEALEFALNELDSIGTEINQLHRQPDDSITVIGYFTEKIDSGKVDRAITDSLAIYALNADCVLQKEWRTIFETDWLFDWKKHWKPTVIGNFVVSPPWEMVDDPTKHVIYIEPNMAFGTGTHDTTQLCLAAIEKHLKPGDSVLDVGTGTGILAIGAALMLRDTQDENLTSEINACDTDAGSIVIARENAVLNGVADDVEFFDGSINDETKIADVVLANLTIDVIIPILDQLIAKSERCLILSGILSAQKGEIVRELSDRGFNDAEIEKSGEWICVIVEKTVE